MTGHNTLSQLYLQLFSHFWHCVEGGGYNDPWSSIAEGHTEIPDDIPTTATSISLISNMITEIKAGDFSAGYFRCKQVQLSRNQISEIEAAAFEGKSCADKI